MAIGFGPTDHFGAGANFHEQRSTTTIEEKTTFILDAAGNKECETDGLDTLTRYENEYAYCNASPDIVTDLGVLLTEFGDLHGSAKVDELNIHFEEGQYATVTIRGHQHAESAHVDDEGLADVSGCGLPADAGFGVPLLTGQVLGADASGISLDLTFRCTHVDRTGADGNHFAGKSVTFRGDVSETFLGIPTTPEATGYSTDSKSDATGNDSNVDFDEFTYTAHKFYDAS